MDIILRIEDESFAEEIRIMKKVKNQWMDVDNVKKIDEILSIVYNEVTEDRPDLIEEE